MMGLIQDVKIALRRLGKAPGFTALGILAMALGIGVNTAIYSLADVALYRPLPLTHLDDLVGVFGKDQRATESFNSLTPADLTYFQEHAKNLTSVSGYQSTSYNLTNSGNPVRARGVKVSTNYFTTLGESPMLGRVFPEQSTASDRTIVLSHALWTRAFNEDRQIVGTTVQLDGLNYEVLGVMPPKIRFPAGVDLWLPLVFGPDEKHNTRSRYLGVVGRLAPNASLEEANAEIRALAATIEREHPDSHTNWSAQLVPLRDHLIGEHGGAFVRLLVGTAILVLLIASANVAILQYARLSSRGRETAVEAALGARRWQLTRKVLVESWLLSLGGIVAGVAAAWGGLRLLYVLMPAELTVYVPNWENLGINAHSFLYACLAAGAAGLIAGILPALFGPKVNLNESLKEAGQGGITRVSKHHRWKRALVVVQVALALALLAGAGVMVKGFHKMTQPAEAHQPDGVLTFRLALPDTQYPNDHEQVRFARALRDAISRMPEVNEAGYVRHLPHTGNWTTSSYGIEGWPDPQPGERRDAQRQSIGADYFEAMRLPLLEGRRFETSDDADALPVAIVSKSFVRKHLSDRQAIGQRIKRGSLQSDREWLTIVGVVDDIMHNLFDRQPRPTVYRPYAQAPADHYSMLVRTSGDPTTLIPNIRQAVASLDPNLALYEVFTLREVVDQSAFGVRLMSAMMSLFGGLALVLCAVGIYSMMAFAVNERVQEIGIRVVLGARRGDVLGKFLTSGARLALVGLLMGILPALALTGLISSITNEVFPAEPTVMLTVLFLLLAVSMLACFVPAYRATRIDPIIALRND